MKLSESVVTSKRKRLSGRTGLITKSSGLGTLVAFLFGLPFIAAGTAITLIGLKIIPMDPSDINAPYWIIILMGGMFAGAGLMVWTMVFRQLLQGSRRRRFARENPGLKVYGDYPWNPRGITKSPWGPAIKSFVVTIVMGIFLAPFNWWAWASGAGGFMVMAIVSLFDFFLLFAFIGFVKKFLMALKYGSSRLGYQTFPYFTGETINLRWIPPSGLAAATGIEFVLRCVEEWTESTGSGDNRRTSIIHEQVWATTRTAAGQKYIQPNRPVDLSFDVPMEAPGSRLAGKSKTTFWELDVTVQAAGIDFSERYLVPIYEVVPELTGRAASSYSEDVNAVIEKQ